MFQTKVTEIKLENADETLKVRRVNASELIMILGFLPDFFELNLNDKQAVIQGMATPKFQETISKWCCAGIVEHGSKILVPKVPKDCNSETEYSYFQLSQEDQLALQAVVIGNDEKKS